MKKGFLILGLTSIVILLFVFSGSLDYVCSLIPGWNTASYPMWFVLSVIILPTIVVALFIKILLKRK